MEIKIHPIVKIIFIILGIIVLFLSYLRFISTNGLIVKEYKVTNKNIGEYHGLKVVHFSDIHYKTTIDKDDLKEIGDKINYINPDIIVFTGDIFDNKLKYSESDIKDLTSFFKSLKASYKKYAIIGDNDDINNYRKVINNSDFTDLNDSYDLIYSKSKKPILIAGISSGTNDIEEKLLKVNNYLSSDKTDQIYSIILMHEPDNIKNIHDFDLALAGHSLNGQIRLPLIGAVRKVNGAQNYYDSYYKINKTNLYISGGLGTNKVKLRYFNKPSINFYRITK